MKKYLAAMLFAPLSAFAAHPLVSDDPGTQGDGNWQIELNGENTSKQAGIGRQQLWSSTLTRGIGDHLDLYVNVPYMRTQNTSDDAGSGIGDAEIGAKWRAYENGPLSIGLKPYLSVPTGNNDKGLGNGRVNGGAKLLVQYDAGESWTLLFNAGMLFQPNRQQDRQNLWQVSSVVLSHVRENLHLVADIGISRNPEPAQDTNPAFAIVGVIYSPAKQVDLDVGYRKGLNPQTYSHSLMAGLTVRW